MMSKLSKKKSILPICSTCQQSCLNAQGSLKSIDSIILNDESNEVVPFVIERIERDSSNLFREISEMCIDVFFNEGTLSSQESQGWSSPFKGFHLAYLRMAQYSDLRNRSFTTKTRFDMFIARAVVPKSSTTREGEKFVDKSSIFNSECLSSSFENSGDQYVPSELIGFCEINARRFPLLSTKLNMYYDDVENKIVYTTNSLSQKRNKDVALGLPFRPILSNLAVKKTARGSGVGSQLLSACEDIILLDWDIPNRMELILQVEEDNPNAVEFYKKRGYQVMYSDPATRRFDVSGIFLRRVRSTKICMRKALEGENIDFVEEKL